MYPHELTGRYTIDPAHSRFGFVARHAMVTKVRGSIPLKKATVYIDAAAPTASSAHVVLEVAGIQTGNDMRDDHLRTGDFLDAANHPYITFDSTWVKHLRGDSFEVTGELTIRGVTRQIILSVDYTDTTVDTEGLTRVGFEGSTLINRKDFGINYNAVLETGGVLISETITLEFDLSAIKDV